VFGFKRRRRARLKKTPFPAPWIAILEHTVPYYKLLSPGDQTELQGHIQVFLHEKQFEGLGGIEMTDEIRVTIAAQACVLLLHRESDYYPSLQSILVYPRAYVVQQARHNPDGTVSEAAEARLGESWYRGEVVLSWDDVLRGAADIHDGHNVVFHEFAHQLDNESASAVGVPALARRSSYIAWARAFVPEYEQMLKDIERHRKTVLNKYGGTNPAEFFAVVTEAFFEKPVQLKQHHPQLYEQMTGYFHQDPASLVEK
jgi:MtfA peptidase